MEVFEYDVTRAGNVRYNAPEGFHDDAIDSLALAVDGMGTVAGAATATVSKGREDEHDGEGIMGAIREQNQRSGVNKWK
jgi:hypothetical protein